MKSYLPLCSPCGLRMESEMGVGRNCSCDSAASLVYVFDKLFAREWIFRISICRGRRNSSRGSLDVAIERQHEYIQE
jgi:hypothetical protein